MGRGSSKAGEGNNTYKFSDGGNNGSSAKDTVADFPARLNVRVKTKNPDEVLKQFRNLHALDKSQEHGLTVDENGYVTQYVHGGANAVAIIGRKGEMVYHNHPNGSAFSKSDMLSTASSAEKGLVASGKNGDYILTKTQNFKAKKFMNAIKNAKLSGKSYDDAVDKWLKANQKKYGYKYKFIKAKK